MLVGMVDCIFADVAQPDQARIVSLNAQHFLKNGGHFVISIKVRISFQIYFKKCYRFWGGTQKLHLEVLLPSNTEDC